MGESIILSGVMLLLILHAVNYALGKHQEALRDVLKYQNAYMEAQTALAHTYPVVRMMVKAVAAAESAPSGSISVTLSNQQMQAAYDADVAIKNIIEGLPQQPVKMQENDD